MRTVTSSLLSSILIHRYHPPSHPVERPVPVQSIARHLPLLIMATDRSTIPRCFRYIPWAPYRPTASLPQASMHRWSPAPRNRAAASPLHPLGRRLYFSCRIIEVGQKSAAPVGMGTIMCAVPSRARQCQYLLRALRRARPTTTSASAGWHSSSLASLHNHQQHPRRPR